MTRLLSVVLLLFTVACSKLKEGEVYERGYKAAETQMILMPIVISDGKNTTTSLIPMFFYYPERWYVSIKAFDGKKWKTSTYWVPQDLYSQSHEGMWFCTRPDCQSDEPRMRKDAQ